MNDTERWENFFVVKCNDLGEIVERLKLSVLFRNTSNTKPSIRPVQDTTGL